MKSYFKFLPHNVISQENKKEHFAFSQFLFWDTPVEKIDPEKHKNYIIERVISRGLLQDFYVLLQLYTLEEIVVALKKSKVLDNKTANFCSHYFNIPLKDLYVSSFYG